MEQSLVNKIRAYIPIDNWINDYWYQQALKLETAGYSGAAESVCRYYSFKLIEETKKKGKKG